MQTYELSMADAMADELEKLANKNKCSTAEILRKALLLLGYAVYHQAEGNTLAIVDKNDDIVTKIVGY